MLTKDQITDILKNMVDPTLHKSLYETNGIRDIQVKDNFVSIKLAIGKTSGPEQMELQQEVVNVLKDRGVPSVGLRFEELSEEEIRALGGVQEEGLPPLLSKDSKTKFIAIASGKGGVGKSTVSVNLAVALARLGKKVGIIDADIYGFSVPDMMGIEERPVVRGERIFPVERYGVKVISMGFFVEDNSPVIWRGPMLGKMLNNFFNEVEWDDLDYLILDLPPGTGDVALDIHTLLPECNEIIVTTPHPTAAFVAARAGSMALRTNHKILGVVENMSYFESSVTNEKEYVFGRGGGEKLAEVLKTTLLGQIPLAQPDPVEGDFAPSIYGEEEKIGQIYQTMAKEVIEELEK